MTAKTLMRYSYKPRPKKKWVRREDAPPLAEKLGTTPREVIEAARRSLYFGVELEFPGPTRESLLTAFGEADADNDNFYCKTDGSIPYTGVEGVCHPATERYHRHLFGWDRLWKELTPLFSQMADVNSPEVLDGLWASCGMHVHVGRKEMGGNLPQWRLQILMTVLADLLKDISGRDYNRYCESLPPRVWLGFIAEDVDMMSLVHGAKPWMAHNAVLIHNRYRALNSTRGSTLELRLFASPRTEEEFWERLETAFALVGFAMTGAEEVAQSLQSSLDEIYRLTDEDVQGRPARVRVSLAELEVVYASGTELTPEAWLAWVNAQRLRFPNLVRKLRETGHLSDPNAQCAQLWFPFVDEMNLSEEEIRRLSRSNSRRGNRGVRRRSNTRALARRAG